MNKRDENLNEILENLYPDKGQDFLRELEAAQQFFAKADIKPQSQVVEAIKLQVTAQCKAEKRNRLYFRVAEMGAVAASIIIVAVMWFGMGGANTDQAQEQFWSTNGSDEAIETQIAQIDNADISLADIVFDDEVNGSDSMESELNAISTSFWEG